MKTRSKIFIIITALLLTAMAGLFLTGRKNAEPPDRDIESARQAISLAERSKSDVYAAADFNNAVSAYDSAINLWKAENKKMFPFRDYPAVRRHALLAVNSANAALQKSSKNRPRLDNIVAQNLGVLEKKILEYENFRKLPLQPEVRKNIKEAEHFYLEAVKLYEEGNLLKSIEKSNKAGMLLQYTDEHIAELLHNWFSMHQQWTSWVEEAISKSRSERSGLIIIDKFGRQCHLYKNGVLQRSFNVELGKNWIGDKQFKGDKTTPEGLYKVVSKKKGKNTKYHKALLLNYPNEQDKIRFNNQKRNGKISGEKLIGNLIEIHGGGGKGFDWTEGCIALTNDDMDELYSQVDTGTAVIIIGSLKPLNHFSKLVQ